MMTRRTSLVLACAALADVAGVVRAAAAAPGRADFIELARRIRGAVLVPSSEGYEAARKTFSFNPSTDVRPAAVVRCVDEADVVRSLTFARDAGLEIAVRGGGHDVLGASTCNGGVVIDTSMISACRLDAATERVTVGPGARIGTINDVLQPAGRALALGDAGSVGVAGLTLGGGLGYLLGRYGAACDNLLRARLVTADGRVRVASSRENPDVFWGLRGGGGNFGIVTELEFTSHAVAEVTGGQIVWAVNDIRPFLRFFRDWVATTPDELTVELTINGDDEKLIFATVCHAGTAPAATHDLAPLVAYGPPAAVGVSRRPYALTAASSAAVRAAAAAHSRPATERESNDAPGVQWLGGSLDGLGDPAIAVVGEHLGRARGGWSFGLGHYMHGAACRVAPESTALVRKPGAFTYHFDAWWGNAVHAAQQMAWLAAAMDAMSPLSRPSYINYLSRNEPAAVRAAYGPHFKRLSALKRALDPDNVFHRNRNVPPLPRNG